MTAKRYETAAEIEAQGDGYEKGVRDCLRILAKWFFMSNRNAKSCRDELAALIGQK